jgi:hypothetical protein
VDEAKLMARSAGLGDGWRCGVDGAVPSRACGWCQLYLGDFLWDGLAHGEALVDDDSWHTRTVV